MSLVHLDGVEHGCCGPGARADAAEVARIGGFPFEICDLTEEFDAAVIADFVDGARGRAHAEPVRAVQRRDQVRRVPPAGRRARDRPGRDGPLRARRRRRRRPGGACSAAPTPRRTSPTCSTCSGSAQLARSLFPVGGLPKAETRALAERFGLPGRDEARLPGALLRARRRRGRVRASEPARSSSAGGEVVDPDGAGARRARRHVRVHGRAAARDRRGDGRAPLRASTSTPRRTGSSWAPASCSSAAWLVADRVSWIAGEPPGGGPFEAEVRIRYRGEDVPCVVEPPASDRVRVEFRSPQRAVAPGQSAVVYRGDEVLGGGRIVEAIR